MKLNETKIIVTGGASGMGRHFVKRFVEEGAAVAAADIDQEALSTLVEECAQLPGSVSTFVCDVSQEDHVVKLIQDSYDAMGGLNALLNNAGIIRDGLIAKRDRKTGEVKKMSMKKWNSVIGVNLTGPFLCAREFAAKLIETDTTSGVIINISSISRHGNRGQSNYSAAKAGLYADTVLWSKELIRYGIRVGAIAPGFIRTPILEGMPPKVLEATVNMVPSKRLGEPEEIFMGVRFILECEYFTGRCLDIDGGLVL